MQLPERWPRCSLTTMVKSLAGAAILLGLYASFEVGHQAYSRALKSRTSWRAEQNINLNNWQRIMPSLATELSEKMLNDPQPVAFSPVDFQREGVRLVSWVPSGSGGDMSLEGPWQQVPSTFSMLAERDMQVLAFSLSAEKGVLSLTLQLVRNEES